MLFVEAIPLVEASTTDQDRPTNDGQRYNATTQRSPLSLLKATKLHQKPLLRSLEA
jgi:hypothetical protein